MIPREILARVTGFLRDHVSKDIAITSSEPLSGGCINSVSLIRTNKGSFCLKYNNTAAFPGMFVAEARGLKLLSDAGTIKVPGVTATGDDGSYSWILLEYIESGRRISGFMEDFGRSLAVMHRNTSSKYGLDHDNYMGSLPQSNKMHENWHSFFVEERLMPQVRLASEKGLAGRNHLSRFERLYKELQDYFPPEPPSLLHGDLWSGNFMVSADGKACLIDPAVYYGHREADLAMTALFGGFGDAFYQSYNESWPLEKGWRERLPVYQLYPLLVHLNLFGRGYLGSIEEIIEKF